MGFWNKIFKGKVFDEKLNPIMAAEMEICGKKYIISKFDLEYDKEVSHEYFLATATFLESVNNTIESWITNTNRKENGVIRFYRNSNDFNEGALFEMKFKDACCVGYSKDMNNGIFANSIVMTFHLITIGDEAGVL